VSVTDGTVQVMSPMSSLPVPLLAHHPLDALRHHLVVAVPRGQADAHCILVHRDRDRLVEVRAPGAANDHDSIELRERLRRRGAGHDFRVLVHLRDPIIVTFAKIEPDTRGARHDVRLVAAVRNDVV
jgi:hypothetical protein